MGKIDINPIMVKLPFPKFEKWFKKWVNDDKLTAKESYIKIGGQLPKKREEVE